MSDKKLILFCDLVGRTVLGEFVSDNGTELLVSNPAIVHIQPAKNGAPGQLQVQVIPFVIQEFIAAARRSAPVTWSFARAGLSVPIDLDIAPELSIQYQRLFNPSPIILPASEAPVINLFDEKK